jgi:hypothetical protein
MVDLPENEQEGMHPQDHKVKPIVNIWVGLLIVYVGLFLSTGYLAFVNIELLPPANEIQEVTKVTDEEVKKFILEAMRVEDAERSKRQSLAIQAFNVVLGALLGFLSASATSLFRRKDDLE